MFWFVESRSPAQVLEGVVYNDKYVTPLPGQQLMEQKKKATQKHN